jgi:hypothetical protein
MTLRYMVLEAGAIDVLMNVCNRDDQCSMVISIVHATIRQDCAVLMVCSTVMGVLLMLSVVTIPLRRWDILLSRWHDQTTWT